MNEESISNPFGFTACWCRNDNGELVEFDPNDLVIYPESGFINLLKEVSQKLD